ncbi:MAG: sodium:proton antiporter [Devosia sp.]|uniref:cation:proton antiporter n=1 Tax=Devosia sp. TaxID=1871048 RepID=UPI002624619C|nr:sodium:proton antiporter [Devosia sp.]MDB5528893.1 sodium:proton antiporter [Devosia sp.]
MGASQILIVMMAAIGLTIFAERKGYQSALFLAMVGIAVSFVPRLPRTELEPDIILGLVLPPLLFSAAVNFSFFSFMKRIGSILNMGVALILVSTVAVGALLGWLYPVMSLPAALILGAVIAPIDAVSAVSIGTKLKLPNRLMTVLKGESLINDAAALALFSAAVAGATGGSMPIDNAALYFLFAASVGAILGVFMGGIVHQLRRQLHNPTMVTALTIITPFAAYMLAEELTASGVMAVVFAGLSLGHNSSDLKFDGRIQQREFLRVVDALLEAFVFAYMGLQFRFVVEDAIEHGYTLGTLAGLSALTLVAVILVRIVWVMFSAVLSKWSHPRRKEGFERRLASINARPTRRGRRGRSPDAKLAEPLGWRENLVLSWSGMRGVVTLAAAAGTPLVTAAGAPLAERDLIVTIAFAVALGTLILQGLTLPWLIKWLGITNDGDLAFRQEQVALARVATQKASIDKLEEIRDAQEDEAGKAFSERMLANVKRDFGLSPAGRGADTSVGREKMMVIVGEMQAARRGALIAERDAERLDDEIVREMLENIDLEQAVIARRSE